MQIIITGSSSILLSRDSRFFMRFRTNVDSYQRVKMINPRRFSIQRVRFFRFFRIQLPTWFFFRFMESRVNFGRFTGQAVNQVTKIKGRRTVTQVRRYRQCIRSSLFKASRQLSLYFQVGVRIVPFLVPVNRSFARFEGACVQLVAVFIQLADVFARYLSYLFQEKGVKATGTRISRVFADNIRFNCFFRFPKGMMFLCTACTVDKNGIVRFIFLLRVRLVFLDLLSVI